MGAEGEARLQVHDELGILGPLQAADRQPEGGDGDDQRLASGHVRWHCSDAILAQSWPSEWAKQLKPAPGTGGVGFAFLSL